MKQIDLEALIDWDSYFLAQAEQSGNGAFSGSPWQRGYGLGSIFQSLIKFLIPIGKSIGKSVGREALHAGTNLAGDLLDGQRFSDALKNRGKEAGRNLVNQTKAHLAAQTGSGKKRGRPPGSKTKVQKRKKATPKKTPKRKKIRQKAYKRVAEDIFD